MKQMKHLFILIKRLASVNSFAAIRDAATISIIFLAYLSAKEIAELRLKNLRFYPSGILVKTNRKVRKILPLSSTLYSIIITYVERLKKLGVSGEANFYLNFETSNAASTTEIIRKMLKRRCEAAGVPNYTPTELRQISLVYSLNNARTLQEALAIMVNSGFVFVSSVANKFGLEDFEKLDPILSEFSDRIKGK